MTAAFNGVPYRGSLVTMGGVMVLGITKAIMAEAGVAAGDAVTVVVENDDAPREVTLPDELEAALRKDRVARAAFEALAYTHRREYAEPCGGGRSGRRPGRGGSRRRSGPCTSGPPRRSARVSRWPRPRGGP